jgi:serine/threonine protein kinase
MGEVFLSEDTRLERKAAIKLLPADVAEDPERRQRFLKEARAASALNHPNVCVVYDVGETGDGHPFIAMEFIDGGSLDSVRVPPRLLQEYALRDLTSGWGHGAAGTTTMRRFRDRGV